MNKVKKHKSNNTLKKVKDLSKEFSFTREMLRGPLTESGKCQ